jgi:hypothetical protein
VSGNGDVDGDVSGEEAAWRDLIARFDLPLDTSVADPPWPAREDLTEPARELPLPERDSALGWDQTGLAGQPGPASPGTAGPGTAGPGTADPGTTSPGPMGPASTGPTGPGPKRPGPASPGPASWPGTTRQPGATGRPGQAGHRRAGPAGADPGVAGAGEADANGTAADGTGADGTGTNDAGTGRDDVSGFHAGGAGQNGAGRDGARRGGTSTHGADDGGPGAGGSPNDSAAPSGGRHAAANGFPRSRARIVRPAGSIPRPSPPGDDEENDDGSYVPPPPEPLPRLDPVAKGAWAGLIGGPGYLLVATLMGWEVSDWAALVAIVAFVAGFATLVLRMGDRPRDDDDNGAVV